MDSRVDRLLASLEEGWETNQDNLLRIASIFELSYRPSRGCEELYEALLGESLINVRLNQAEQEAVIGRLIDLMERKRIVGGVLWAIGKANARAVVKHLGWFAAAVPRMDEGAIWEGLILLRNVMVRDPATGPLQEVVQALCEHPLDDLIRAGRGSREQKVRELADYLADRIVRYCDDRSLQ